MLGRFSIPRRFLLGGAALGVAGILLWLLLPLRLGMPPFLFTALLAMAYGAYGLRRRASAIRPPPPAKPGPAR